MKVVIKDKTIKIDFEKSIFANSFFQEFYELQKILDTRKFDNIYLDLSNAIWIDLMCLSYLVLTFIKNKDMHKSNFELYLFNEFSYNELEHIRLINYLNTNHVFRIFKDYLDISVNIKEIESFIEKHKDNLIESEFQLNECVIPLTIINNQNYISQNDVHLYEQLKLAIGNDISKYEFDMLYNKFFLFLQETVENVFEHAYLPNENHKYCAIIVRKNNKKIAESVTCTTERIYDIFEKRLVDKQTYQKEIEKVSPYGNRYKNDKTAYLEIFVTDIGCGLLKSFNVTDPHDDRNIIQKIFSNGERSSKQSKTSIAGGLYMIHNLLSESNDSISIKSDLNWTNFKCSDQAKSEESFSYIYSDSLYQSKIVHGFSIVGYIGMNMQDDKIKKHFLGFNGENDTYTIKDKIDLLLNKHFDDMEISEITKDTTVIDLRFGQEYKDEFIKTDNNCLVLFPSKHLSSKTIQKFVTTINKTNELLENIKHLIIADIPDNEINKYFNIFDKNKLLIKRLVLISQSINTSVFEFSDRYGQLNYSKIETIKFCNSTNPNIAYSIKSFCQWIRIYDSLQMWRFISDYQKQTGRNVFINGLVNWCGQTLDGYLDFSQVMTIQKCNQLCMYQMFRLFGNTKIYFESIERFTVQLCEQTNKLKNLSIKNQKIGIGSVYVTGVSSIDTPIEDIELKIYFFNHSNTNDSIVSFFEWATNKIWINNNFPQDTTCFERIGNTPFISNQGNRYFMERHYSNIKDMFEIAPSTMYSLIQDNYGLSSTSISQMGHFNLDGKHDFMLVDVISLFRKAKIQRMSNPKYDSNCWDYTLCELYYSLTGYTDQSLKKISSNLNPSIPHKENLVRKIKSYAEYKQMPKTKGNFNGLIIYLNDFQTTYIIEELKHFFSDTLQKNFYSIPTVLNDRTSTSLLISPLLTNILESNIMKLRESAEVTTTIFSAITTSTKLRKELKHVVFRLGSDKVKTLTIIDRQRFTFGTYNSNTHSAFMKLDLPDLGSKNSCVLCKGLEVLKDFKKNTNSSFILERIDNILDMWGAIKPSDDHHNIGIKIKETLLDERILEEIRKICQKYSIETVNVHSNFGLILFFIENVAISMSLELLDICLGNTKLDKSTKILMICSYLAQFNHNEISYSKRINLCIMLYQLMHNQTKSDICTALGLIILMSNLDIKDRLYNEYVSTKNNKVCSLDIFIYKLYLYNETKILDGYNYDFHCYLNTEESIPSIIYAINLFSNTDSKHNHARNLIRFYQEGKEFGKIEYKDAINATEYLIEEYKKLPNTLYYDTKKLKGGIEQVNIRLHKLKNTFAESLSKIDEYKYGIPKELKQNLEAFFSSARFVNELILCPTEPIIVYNKLKNIYQEAISDFDIKTIGDVCISTIAPSKQKHWFYFYNDIIEEIKYFVGDFRHSKGEKIKNRISSSSDEHEYTGIIQVEFTDTAAIFKFYNSIKDDITEESIIAIKKSKSHRPTMLDFDALERRLEGENKIVSYKIYEQNKSIFDTRVLEVKLLIPYIDNNKE